MLSRSTRSTSKTTYQQNRLDAYKAHEQLPTIPIVPLPNLHIFIQPNPADKSTRFNADTNPAYTKTQSFLYLLFSHIIASDTAKWKMGSMFCDMSTYDLDCRNHLWAKLGEERNASSADIESYLSQTPPSVIFTGLNKKAGAIVWGEVRKGEEEDAAKNELFMSDEFLNVMEESLVPQDMTEDDKQLRVEYSKLLFSATVLHEIVHCLTKNFFGRQIITPKLPDFEADGNQGEAGRTFEKYYFGFLVEAWWKIEDIPKEPRLWYVDALCGHYLNHSRILAVENINKVLHSLTKNAIWKIAEKDGEKVPRTMNNNTHRRCRGGGMPIPIPAFNEPEVKHLDYGLPDRSRYVRVGTVCAGSSQWFK